jgi:23S rRNA (cytosine1962-C5)-methyltransferase
VNVAALLLQAAERRAHLALGGTTIYRAAHLTETGGEWTLERAGDTGVLSLYRDLSEAEERELAAVCGETLGLTGVYLKRRPPEARHLANTDRERLSPPLPVWGEAQPELTVLEGGVPFLIRPGADLSVGLFTDARPARAWVREHAAGAVLNTFAYTCGFGLMAALGGATVVKNFDASRKVLGWGRENYALSGLPAPQEDFVYGDVFGWLERLHRQGRTSFDLVVLDPPSFARGERGAWRAEKDDPSLVTLATRVLGPQGRLLCLTNHAGLPREAFERAVRTGVEAAGRVGRVTARFGAGEDYPGATHLKVVAVETE